MHPSRHPVLVAASLAAVLCLAGCGERSDDDTVAQAARRARQEARESGASGASSARPRTGELPSSARDRPYDSAGASRGAATDGDTNVMGAARDARVQAYGTDPNATPGSADRSKVDDGKIASMVLRGLKADSRPSGP
jgi:hypothetical protein